MRFTISRKDLQPALKLAVAAAETKATIPILSNVLLAYSQGALVITGTDSEIQISTCVTMQHSIDESDYGAIAVPARKFLDIVKELSADAEITIMENETKTGIEIKSGKSKFKLQSLPADDFPAAPVVDADSGTVFQMPTARLAQAIQTTAYAMAINDARHYLNGMFVELSENGINFVATDGHRLAGIESDAVMFPTDEFPNCRSVILPNKFINELKGMLDSEESVEVSIDESHIQINVSPHLTITSKLIDGKYPDWRGVLPSCRLLVTTYTAHLVKALQQAKILSNEKYHGVRLAFSTDKLVITGSNPNQEESEIELSVDYQGEPLEIGFNVDYLLNALGAITSPVVNLKFVDGSSSCLIQNDADGGDGIYHVIMPVRL
jgi:DNA polymerase-3 subunit beta